MNKTTSERIINEIETALRNNPTYYIYDNQAYALRNRECRAKLIRRITDDYVTANGKAPDAPLLDRLADAMLYEELTDKSRSKIYVEHPVLSDTQTKARTSREVPLSTVSDDVSTIELTIIRYESAKERLRREIDSEFKRYTEINRLMPLTVRKATAEELARIAPTPGYTRSRLDYEWSYDVRRRDGFTCQKCGRNRGRMHAHHIESYHANFELRTDLNNGVTLCDRCHFEFHDIYGYKHNTREQFNEWMRGDYYELSSTI